MDHIQAQAQEQSAIAGGLKATLGEAGESILRNASAAMELSASSTEVARTAQDLSAVAHDLTGLVRRFRH